MRYDRRRERFRPDRDDRFAQALCEIVWLPDERLRFAAYGGHPGAAGLCRDRDAPKTPISSSSTPATSARRRPRRSIPSLAACAAEGSGERPTAAAYSSRLPAASPRPKARRSMRRAPAVDLVVGPQSYHRLPDLIARAERDGERRRYRFPAETNSTACRAERAATRARGVTAFLTVQEGCDKFCTFCVVPYTRGAEMSRPVDGDRGRGRAARWPPGVREVTLLGQNVNAYHGDGPDGGLVAGAAARRLARISGPRAAALHHQPSARHGRRADRGASRLCRS